MAKVLYLVAVVGAGCAALMALSMLSVRMAGYHVSGFGGWLFALLGWGLAVLLTKGLSRDQPDVFN